MVKLGRLTFTRNAKIYGIQFTKEFLHAAKKTNDIINRISRYVRAEIKSGKIISIGNLGYVMMSDGTEMTTAKYKDAISHLFDEDCVSESLKRQCVFYVFERYASYLKRNGDKELMNISIKGKTFYYKDNFVSIDRKKKTITFPTMFGKFTLKYHGSLKADLITKAKFGGNLSFKQGTFVVAVKAERQVIYNAVCAIGLDFNKTMKDWVVLDDGTRILASIEIEQLMIDIREINKELKADKKKPVKERQYRNKRKYVKENGEFVLNPDGHRILLYPSRREKRLEWKRLHNRLNKAINKVVDKIIDIAKERQALLCIDSVKTGQKMGTFGQDHLIPALQTKCENQGIPFYVVPCKDTSRRCTNCGYIHKDNRKSTDEFRCMKCGFEIDAQQNGAENIKWNGQKMLDAKIPYGDYKRRNVDKLITQFISQ